MTNDSCCIIIRIFVEPVFEFIGIKISVVKSENATLANNFFPLPFLDITIPRDASFLIAVFFKHHSVDHQLTSELNSQIGTSFPSCYLQ